MSLPISSHKRKRKKESPVQEHSVATPAPDMHSDILGPRYAASPCFDLATNDAPLDDPPLAELAEPVVRDPGPGQPLKAALREKLEKRFNGDLSHIRVHTGPDATKAAGSLEAAAFTHGHHIFLSDSKQADDTRVMAGVMTYPGVRTGRRCIFHSGVVLGSDGFGIGRICL